MCFLTRHSIFRIIKAAEFRCLRPRPCAGGDTLRCSGAEAQCAAHIAPLCIIREIITLLNILFLL